ncbi:hypothetical protein [Ligilactobacillus animalis]|uniref:hypothetical protein n=1 Tax=Ligilactobacillus animalis TaxID=1605 RepID=UPI00082441D4|nr:hypothetical protein [Ligilactobacillus animalis]OCX47513.1 hypothetical protein BFC98_08120 [Ligilactobacillus animalis]QHQ69483.1 hypothetical protein GSR62_01485 [Ligilactobacillus animalis]
MSDLKETNNIYINLAKGAYIGREEGMNFTKLSKSQSKEISDKKYASFVFPHAKDAYGNDASEVYLQPDKLETVKEKIL